MVAQKNCTYIQGNFYPFNICQVKGAPYSSKLKESLPEIMQKAHAAEFHHLFILSHVWVTLDGVLD
jgi:hypothetical protein